MCIYRRYIKTLYHRREVLVPCGQCAACMQQKAINRTNRIRNTYVSDGSQLCLFVTLTYENEHVPYFRLHELRNACSEDGVVQLPIYRDCNTRYVRSSSSHVMNFRKDTSLQEPISYVEVPTAYQSNEFQLLKKSHQDKVGVIFYDDVQNYIKKLRRRLEYEGYDYRFQYFSCAEYGAKTCRPHFHLLFFIPTEAYSVFSRLLCACWSFDDNDPSRRRVEVAFDAAAYVSSYVNCSSVVPPLFRHVNAFRQKHSYSQGFGMALEPFSLYKIREAFYQRDLRYDVQRLREGTLTYDRVLLPKYVINRFFPQIKGFSRLSSHDLVLIYARPECIGRYANRLDYSSDDVKKWRVCISNKHEIASRYGISVNEYALIASQIWSLRSLNALHDFYQNIQSVNDYKYAYDNIIHYLYPIGSKPRLKAPSLDCLDISFDIHNPNNFPLNRAKSSILAEAFYSYDKSKKVRSLAFDDAGLNF